MHDGEQSRPEKLRLTRPHTRRRVAGSTFGLEFDFESSDYCLINESAEETEGTVEACDHISFLSVSLCLFTINNNKGNTLKMKVQLTSLSF